MNNKLNWQRSLAYLFPDISKEWDPTKNKNSTPELVTECSNEGIWWLCSKGHSYNMSVVKRTRGRNCYYCSKINRDNSFAAVAPEIAKEWHPTKNGYLTPNNVTKASAQKVWWSCPKGHEYNSPICSRYTSNSGCPYCSGKKACKDNSLASIFPLIAKEWHPTRNENITPELVTKYSNKLVWWLCPKGHNYQMVIEKRTLGRNCPFCSGRKVCKDNCLATLAPEIAKEWHPTKNEHLTPNDVTKGRQQKVWWLCPNKHEYQAMVKSRTILNHACPYCSGRKACKDNCLATLAPEIAKEWHPTKNEHLTPNDVTKGRQQKVWWLCSNKHEYQAMVKSRTILNHACPYCSGKK